VDADCLRIWKVDPRNTLQFFRKIDEGNAEGEIALSWRSEWNRE